MPDANFPALPSFVEFQRASIYHARATANSQYISADDTMVQAASGQPVATFGPYGKRHRALAHHNAYANDLTSAGFNPENLGTFAVAGGTCQPGQTDPQGGTAAADVAAAARGTYAYSGISTQTCWQFSAWIKQSAAWGDATNGFSMALTPGICAQHSTSLEPYWHSQQAIYNGAAVKPTYVWLNDNVGLAVGQNFHTKFAFPMVSAVPYAHDYTRDSCAASIFRIKVANASSFNVSFSALMQSTSWAVCTADPYIFADPTVAGTFCVWFDRAAGVFKATNAGQTLAGKRSSAITLSKGNDSIPDDCQFDLRVSGTTCVLTVKQNGWFLLRETFAFSNNIVLSQNKICVGSDYAGAHNAALHPYAFSVGQADDPVAVLASAEYRFDFLAGDQYTATNDLTKNRGTLAGTLGHDGAGGYKIGDGTASKIVKTPLNTTSCLFGQQKGIETVDDLAHVGQASLLRIPSSEINVDGAFSLLVEYWCLAASHGAGHGSLFGLGDTATGARMACTDSSVSSVSIAGNTFAINTRGVRTALLIVARTGSSGTFDVYQDGNFIGTGTKNAAAGALSANDICFGGYFSGGSYVPLQDKMGLWSVTAWLRELTATEIANVWVAMRLHYAAHVTAILGQSNTYHAFIPATFSPDFYPMHDSSFQVYNYMTDFNRYFKDGNVGNPQGTVTQQGANGIVIPIAKRSGGKTPRIVIVGASGQTAGYWLPSQGTNVSNTMGGLMAAAWDLGGRLAVDRILWIQGETEAGAGSYALAVVYAASLAATFGYFRDILRDPALPIYQPYLSSDPAVTSLPNASIVNAQMDIYRSGDSRYFPCVNTTTSAAGDFETPDGPHYSNNGKYKVGASIGAAIVANV